ncbi:DNA helicase II / ATP-dependent DNA helicase PcrA, partial [Candidatus Hakubella thermalkaliphila]
QPFAAPHSSLSIVSLQQPPNLKQKKKTAVRSCFFFSDLQSTSFAIYDDGDQQTVVKNVMKEMLLDDSRFKPRSVLAVIGRAKNEMIDQHPYAEEADNFYTRTIARIYKNYQERLRLSNALDFDDLLLYLVRLLTDYPAVLAHYQKKFRYILVDEYQDINRVQYKIVSMLAGSHR